MHITVTPKSLDLEDRESEIERSIETSCSEKRKSYENKLEEKHKEKLNYQVKFLKIFEK